MPGTTTLPPKKSRVPRKTRTAGIPPPAAAEPKRKRPIPMWPELKITREEVMELVRATTNL